VSVLRVKTGHQSGFFAYSFWSFMLFPIKISISITGDNRPGMKIQISGQICPKQLLSITWPEATKKEV